MSIVTSTNPRSLLGGPTTHLVVFKSSHRHKPGQNNHKSNKFYVAASAASAASPDLQDRLQHSIAVVGGGPAGLATALALQRVGLPAVVLEREAGPSTAGSALGLWTNAWKALDALGAGDALRQQHPIVNRVELCRQDNRVLRSFSLSQCEGGPHEFRGVRRSSLTEALTAQLLPGTVIYNTPITGASTPRSTPSPSSATSTTVASSGVVLKTGSGEELHCVAAVGADGVRGGLIAAAGRRPARYVGQVAIRGVAEIPGGNLPCECIRQVWSVGPRAGMYPISDTELYWYVCFDASSDAPIPPTPQAIKQEALNVVKGWGWGIADIITATPLTSLSRSRIVDRWDLPSKPNNTNSGTSSSSSGGIVSNTPLVTLAGDALHPMTPNLGQGGCTSLEDAVVLARTLKAAGVGSFLNPSNSNSGGVNQAQREIIRAAFAEYEQERLQRCLPLTVRSFAFGAALQLPLPLVAAVRDVVVGNFFNPSHFLDHATYDCGKL